MKYLKNFENHSGFLDKKFLTVNRINEEFNPRDLFTRIIKNFPTIEEFWYKTLGKPKFSSTSNKQGKPRSASSQQKRSAVVSRTGWGNISSSLQMFDNTLKTIAVGEYSNWNKFSDLVNNTNCARCINKMTKENDTILASAGKGNTGVTINSDGSVKGIFLHELLTLLQAVKSGKITRQQLLEVIPASTNDNPTFRQAFEKILFGETKSNLSLAKIGGVDVFSDNAGTVSPLIKPTSNFEKLLVSFSKLSPYWTKSGKYDVIETSKVTEKMVDDLKNKVSDLSNRAFDPKKCSIVQVTEAWGREILQVTLENGKQILIYKSTGGGGKILPPPGGWSVIPGFISEAALLGGKKIDLWFCKTEKTIAMTHTDVKGNGTNKYLSELAQFLEKNSPSGLMK